MLTHSLQHYWDWWIWRNILPLYEFLVQKCDLPGLTFWVFTFCILFVWTRRKTFDLVVTSRLLLIPARDGASLSELAESNTWHTVISRIFWKLVELHLHCKTRYSAELSLPGPRWTAQVGRQRSWGCWSFWGFFWTARCHRKLWSRRFMVNHLTDRKKCINTRWR